MGSSTPKVLHPAAGRPLLDWVLDLAVDAGCERSLVVIGHGVTGNKERPWALALSAALQAAGISSLRFSFAGNGGVFVARKDPGAASFGNVVMAAMGGGWDKGWMAAGPDPSAPTTQSRYTQAPGLSPPSKPEPKPSL